MCQGHLGNVNCLNWSRGPCYSGKCPQNSARSFPPPSGGRLGNGDARHQQAPTPILEGVRSVTAGHSHCFALLERHGSTPQVSPSNQWRGEVMGAGSMLWPGFPGFPEALANANCWRCNSPASSRAAAYRLCYGNQRSTRPWFHEPCCRRRAFQFRRLPAASL